MRDDRFVGCVLGQCLGDALGFVVEGHPTASCASYVDGVLRSGKAGALGRGTFAFGQYTDDSQLMRELLESIVAHEGSFSGEDYGRRVAAIFSEERIVGRGRATQAAAERLAAGVPWRESGTPAPIAGNGSAMRAAPIGLFFGRDRARLCEAGHDQSIVTHSDPRCIAGSIAIASAVASALDDEISPRALCDRAAGEMEAFHPEFAASVLALEEIVALPPAEAVKQIARPELDHGYGNRWEGISPYVIPSVVWSMYSFLRSPDDYWETICTAIAVGGDVDTTAAMAGAISGAHLGKDVLPPALVAQLNDQGTWKADALEALARRAAALAT